MEENNNKLRPAFRILAGLLTVGSIFGVIMAIYEILNDIGVGHPWGFLVGCIFSGIIFGFAAFSGTVPNWLVRQ